MNYLFTSFSLATFASMLLFLSSSMATRLNVTDIPISGLQNLTSATSSSPPEFTLTAEDVHRLISTSLNLPSPDGVDEFLELVQSVFEMYPSGGYPFSGSSQSPDKSYSVADCCHGNDEHVRGCQEFCNFSTAVDSGADQANRTDDRVGDTQEVSPLCRNRTTQLKQSASHKKKWALKMRDANGRPGPGVFQLRLNWFGSYDECRDVQAPPSGSDSSWRGQYCLVTILLKEIPSATALIGLCVPEGCSNDDVNIEMVDDGVPELKGHHLTVDKVVKVDCKPRDVPWDSAGVGVLVLLSLITVTTISATLYDVLVPSKTVPRILAGPKDLSALLRPTGGEATEETMLLTRPLPSVKASQWRNMALHFISFVKRIKTGVFIRVYLSFSLVTSWNKLVAPEIEEPCYPSLFQSPRSPKFLRCLHGVRVLSMLWIILSHTCYYATVVPAANTINAWEKYRKWWLIQPIMNGILSADIFFAISGLLVCYHSLAYMNEHSVRPGVFRLYLRRYLRLTPLYALIIAIAVAITPHLGDGPLWPEKGLGGQCPATWWSNLFYFNNFISEDRGCLGWSWYLANDMQFYVFSPIFIFALYYFPALGLILCFLFLAASILATGFLTKHYNVPAGPSVRLDFMTGEFYQNYIIKPYSHVGPYVIGMVTGWLLQKKSCTGKINKTLHVCLWAAAVSSCLAVLYGTVGMAGSSQSLTSFYLAMRHVVAGAGACWVVYACSTNNAGLVNAVLSWKGWLPLSRLTFCVSLIHPLFILGYYLSLRVPFFITKFSIIIAFTGNAVISYSAAFVLYMMIESPAREITRIAL